MTIHEKFDWIQKELASNTILWVYDDFGYCPVEQAILSNDRIYLTKADLISDITFKKVYGYNGDRVHPHTECAALSCAEMYAN